MTKPSGHQHTIIVLLVIVLALRLLSTGRLAAAWAALQNAIPGSSSAAPSGGSGSSASGGPLNGAYGSDIRSAAAGAGISPALLAAVVQQESGGNAQAVSPTGAQGLTQLEPATAQSLGVTNAFDPVQNLKGGATYLASLIKQFGSTQLGLAAYNAGPGAVATYGGIPPYPETQAYVRNVLSLQNQYGGA